MSRLESKLVQLLVSEWSLKGERSMGAKSVYAQSYRTQSKLVIACYARPRKVREVPLRPVRSASTNTTLARHFATCHRQRFVDRVPLNARAGIWQRAGPRGWL